uniref:Cytoskeleton associated protein 4 n=1 Tax=Astatotilapia calliptera TaxID=8154 RepID=A0AAX7TGX5_ASTCA
MTAKKPKNSDKSAASSQEDAPKKTQKSSHNGASAPGPQGSPRPGSCLSLLVTTVFYVALIGAAGFAAFHVQQALDEIRQTSAKHEESARQSAELSGKMEGAISRMKRAEVETRRVEEALQRLQNDLLRDLSEGINDVKEAREKDFSSLEKTIEERLAEASQSIKASVAEFTEAQSEAQSQLADLKARLGDIEDPALIKQELSAIVDAVAEIKTAKDAADSSGDSLRQQISAVREELQTRNREVASVSQEIETLRKVMQDTTANLRESLSSTEASLQALKDKAVMLESGMEQFADAVRNVDEQVNEAATQALLRTDDLAARVKASEENVVSMSASVSDINSKVQSLFDKHDAHESSLAAQGKAVEDIKTNLEQELEAVKSSLEDLQSSIAALEGDKTELPSADSSLGVVSNVPSGCQNMQQQGQ